MTGQTISHYRVGAKLGNGGMGMVYEAEDTRLGRTVALKFLAPHLLESEEHKMRFLREAKAVASLDHPNICTIYDAGESDGLMFLAMGFVDGPDLRAKIRERPLKLDDALDIAIQAADGLRAAHQKGIVHRDIKSSNLMLTSSGQVKVMDFGTAQLSEEARITKTESVVGTPAYMSPEQAQRQKADLRTDIWSLGVVLYEMVTGRLPFEGEHEMAVIYSIINEQHEPVTAIRAGLPVGLDRILNKALAKKAEARYQHVADLLVDLKALRDQHRNTISNSSAHAVKGTWRLKSQNVLREARSVSQQKVFIAALALVATFGVIWLNWPRIEKLLQPLPDRRFVALIAWPTEQDPELRGLLHATLDSISGRLGRAESTTSNFSVISAADVAGQGTLKTIREATSLFGANLALGVSLRLDGKTGLLNLRLFDALSGSTLRERGVTFLASEVSHLAERAASEASDLLDLPTDSRRRTDQEEMSKLSPAAYRLFQEAEVDRDRPNDTGLNSAIEKYQKILELEPRFALGYASLALAYSRKFSRTGDRAFLKIAEKNAAQAVRHNSDSARAVHSGAVVALYSGETESAIAGFQRALELDRGNPRILLHSALAFRHMGRAKEEERIFRQIIRERPNFWPAHNELGQILHRQGQYEAAAAAFAEAAVIAPKVALPLANQATMYLLLGRQEEAEVTFRRSLERAPNEIALMNMGSILFNKGDYRAALDHYDQARNLRPDNHRAWRNLADCYAMLGDSNRELEHYRKAAELLSRALDINPRPGTNWMTLAFYQAKCGRRAAAESGINTAESLGATDMRSQFLKAQTLAILGQKEESFALLMKCLDQGLSILDVELALALTELRADPRYRRYLAERKLKP
jgi:serine/threonine protein kinase/Tfp pilus assembly protein PilF